MSIEHGPSPDELGQPWYKKDLSQDANLDPENRDHPFEIYDKAMVTLNKTYRFIERMDGSNRKNIEAMLVLLNHMMAEDHSELLPEGIKPPSSHEPSEEGEQSFQNALVFLEEYIQENRRQH